MKIYMDNTTQDPAGVTTPPVVAPTTGGMGDPTAPSVPTEAPTDVTPDPQVPGTDVTDVPLAVPVSEAPTNEQPNPTTPPSTT